MDNNNEIVERDDSGRFLTSGNPNGRPKGSKNRVTLLKLMAEEAVREKSTEDMLRVAELVIRQAMDGDTKSQKLVWDAIMSKGSSDDKTQGKEKVEINIGGVAAKPEPVQVTEITITEDDTDEQESN